MFDKLVLKIGTPLFLCSITLSSAGMSLNSKDMYSHETAFSLNAFDRQEDIDKVLIRADFTEKTLNRNLRFIKQGKGSLRLFADNKADGEIDGYPTLSLDFKDPIDLSHYKGLGFWLYAPEDVPQHFFGRHDVAITLNSPNSEATQNLNLANPSEVIRYSFSGLTLRAISAGWHYYFWDFKTNKTLPKLSNITIRFGQIMQTYSTAELYIDDMALHPANSVEDDCDLNELIQVVQESQDWSERYSALKALTQDHSTESLRAELLALDDEALVVRELAIDTVPLKIQQLGARATDVLVEMFESDRFIVREAVLRIVADSPKAYAHIVDKMLDTALTDDVHYVRHLAFSKLLERGNSPYDVAQLMLKKLSEAQTDEAKIKCIRTLDMIGPEASSATSALLNIIRKTENSFMLRAWALKAMWWIAEEQLTPNDLALGLQLKPGQIHRHILDIISKRLVAHGAAALPVLHEKLKDINPKVRARSAALLGHIGQPAHKILPHLNQLLKDAEWYVAWEAAKAIEKITGEEFAKMPNPAAPQSVGNVIVEEKGDYTVISNGLTIVTFKNNDQSPGPVDVREPGGKNIVDGEWLSDVLAFKYSKSPSFREKQWLQRLWGSRFPADVSTEVRNVSQDEAEFVYTFKDSQSPFIISFHYLMKKGLKGFYSYIVAKNISGKEMPNSHIMNSGEGMGRFNYLVALTPKHFEYSMLHDMHKGPALLTEDHNYIKNKLPQKYTYMNCTTRLPDGQIWAKHEWERYELESPVTGYCGKNGGFWLIIPDLDFFFDAYPRWTKGGNYDNLFIPHIESKYSAGGLSSYVDANFEKIYGPMLFYMNDGDNIDEMWTDAKRQADVEVKQWPYKWMTHPRYNDRGAVTGKLSFEDGTSALGTYVVLGDISEDSIKDKNTVFRWMYSKSPYNYFTMANADGSFHIPNVHQGEYDLSVYKPGVLGVDMTVQKIRVRKNGLLNVGTIEIEPYSKGDVIWRIGIPDGSSAEFKNGGNFHNWDNYERYFMDFPSGVNFTIGKSDDAKDWNCIQPTSQRGVWKPTTNTINFEINKIPDGEVVLSTVITGRKPHLDVILNGHKIADLKISVNLGGQTLRSADYGSMALREIVVPKRFLKRGMNTLQLTFARGLAKNPRAAEKLNKRWTSQIMYDYLQLEER